MLTGQHHARETLTSTMVLYSGLKLLHSGLVKKNKEELLLLAQNKYYLIPVINPDGVAYIEK